MVKYSLPELPYRYDSLEPYIDSKTMEIHYTKHHQAYIDKLNDALAKHPEIADIPVENLLKDLNEVPEDIRIAVRNHGGGYVNHCMFWEIMSPEKQVFSGVIAEAINKFFGSLDKFKEAFANAAIGRFGSGWVWLVLNGKNLEIYTTANQDSPISEGKIPILCLDLWEHSYYLKWQSNRKGYIESWWNIVNWNKVNELFEMALKSK